MSTQDAPLMSTQNAPLMSASNIALLELLNNSSKPTNAPLAPHIRRAPSTNAPSTNAPLNETPLSRALRTESLDLSSSRVISQRLSEIEKANESLLRVMNRLVKVCPHCNAFMLVNKRQPLLIYKPHSWYTCMLASDSKTHSKPCKEWKETLHFSKNQCSKCGLPLSICRRRDRGLLKCDYMEIMLPWLFILYKEHPNWL